MLQPLAGHKALCKGAKPLPGSPNYRLEGRCKEHLVVGWERHNCVIGVLAGCAVTLMVEPHSVDENLNGSRSGLAMRRNAVDPKQAGLLQSFIVQTDYSSLLGLGTHPRLMRARPTATHSAQSKALQDTGVCLKQRAQPSGIACGLLSREPLPARAHAHAL